MNCIRECDNFAYGNVTVLHTGRPQCIRETDKYLYGEKGGPLQISIRGKGGALQISIRGRWVRPFEQSIQHNIRYIALAQFQHA